MKLLFKLIQSIKLRPQKRIIKLFALLGYKLNSYHSLKVNLKNLITAKNEDLIVYNQFIPSYMRHPVAQLQVAFWALTEDDFKKMNIVANFNFYGDTYKNGVIEFYFPIDLSDEYPQLIASLGPPHEIIEGYFNPSGRSMWLLPKSRNPLCLKIDTVQLEDKKFFSERVLLATGVLHSVAVTNYLKDDHYNCSEDRGGNIFFNFNYEGQPKRYTYLLREYDFKKLDIGNSDFIIPVVALLSTEFWSNPSLLKALKIKKPVVDFLSEDFAKCYADLIKNSLQNTFLHFEVHQQNLSLHIRNGCGVKIIYHDLQDTVFDTVSYILKNSFASGKNDLEKSYNFAAQYQKNLSLNSHGHLLMHNRITREYFTVVSIYRRYLRNFGAYNKSLNYFLNPNKNVGQYFADKSFEKEVLKHLHFTPDELESEKAFFSRAADKEFLEKDLFWSIYQFHNVLQKNLLQEFRKHISFFEINITSIDTHRLEQMLKSSTTLYSNGFPINILNIDFSKVSQVLAVYEERILLVTYKGEEFLIVRFY